jgi:hypothetical protein
MAPSVCRPSRCPTSSKAASVSCPAECCNTFLFAWSQTLLWPRGDMGGETALPPVGDTGTLPPVGDTGTAVDTVKPAPQTPAETWRVHTGGAWLHVRAGGRTRLGLRQRRPQGGEHTRLTLRVNT